MCPAVGVAVIAPLLAHVEEVRCWLQEQAANICAESWVPQVHQSGRGKTKFSVQEGVWEEDSKKESSGSSLLLGHGPLTIPALPPSYCF